MSTTMCYDRIKSRKAGRVRLSTVNSSRVTTIYAQNGNYHSNLHFYPFFSRQKNLFWLFSSYFVVFYLSIFLYSMEMLGFYEISIMLH